MSSYNLLGRVFYLRKLSLYGLGLKIHVSLQGRKDYLDTKNKIAYLVSEAIEKEDRLLIPIVNIKGICVGFYKI